MWSLIMFFFCFPAPETSPFIIMKHIIMITAANIYVPIGNFRIWDKILSIMAIESIASGA
jgi:hypothetical protein